MRLGHFEYKKIHRLHSKHIRIETRDQVKRHVGKVNPFIHASTVSNGSNNLSLIEDKLLKAHN